MIILPTALIFFSLPISNLILFLIITTTYHYVNFQYDNLNIGEGCIIKVTRASFTPSTTTTNSSNDISMNLSNTSNHGNETPTNNNNNTDNSQVIHHLAGHSLRNALPLECMVDTNPVVLLFHVYDVNSLDYKEDPNYFPDLEVKSLIE